MELIIERIGIAEYRNIITSIKHSYDIDFSDYALTSLKRRFEKTISLYNFKNSDDLIAKIQTDPLFFENLLRDISVDTTEMFRDPTMWSELKDKILLRHKDDNDFKIWVPEITSDDELYSLVILLKEINLLDRFKIYATCVSSKNLDRVRRGENDIKKMETNTANYRKLRGDFLLTRYFELEEKRAILNSDLLKDVVFLRHDIMKEKPPAQNFKLVLFRNRMLYFNPQLQSRIVDTVYECMAPGGYFVIGINESLDCCIKSDGFSAINPNENIYKKIIL